ncbi:MAG: DUF6273 domain-containing protein [Clostridia bacterium]|nr:DUF6273 domain-containing protein [Clostridia bacterium]
MIEKKLKELVEAVRPTQYKVGKIVEFGSYPQWKQNSDFVNSPIKWLVLAKNGHRYLLHSCYGLDCRPYNKDYADITWENCTLRQWLNNEFVNQAFDDNEKQKIVEVNNSNPDNVVFKNSGGNNTNDKVFLLSNEEVIKYYDSKDGKCRKPTEYALNNGAWKDDDSCNCVWWLRSPGDIASTVTNVSYDGFIYYSGRNVLDDTCVIIPALWMEL